MEMIRGSSALLCHVLQMVDSMSFRELLSGMANTWRLWCFLYLVPGAELSASPHLVCVGLFVVMTPLKTPSVESHGIV